MSEHERDPDRITIPMISIVDDWMADDVSSVDECDDATIKLNSLIAEIEFQLDMESLKPPSERDETWMFRAHRALKYKRIGLQIVARRRGAFSRAEKRAQHGAFNDKLLEKLKRSVPDVFEQCLKETLAELAK